MLWDRRKRKSNSKFGFRWDVDFSLKYLFLGIEEKIIKVMGVLEDFNVVIF